MLFNDIKRPTRSSYHRIKRKLSDVIYRVKCVVHPEFKFHKLDLRCSSYTHGFIDSDTKIELALFAIVRDFVEGEDGLEHLRYQISDESTHDVDWTRSPEYIADMKRVINIVERAYAYAKSGEWPSVHTFIDNNGTLVPDNNDVTKLLHELIDIRAYLWT